MASSKASKYFEFILVRMGSEGYRGVGGVDEEIALTAMYCASISLSASPVFLRSFFVGFQSLDSQLELSDDSLD